MYISCLARDLIQLMAGLLEYLPCVMLAGVDISFIMNLWSVFVLFIFFLHSISPFPAAGNICLKTNQTAVLIIMPVLSSFTHTQCLHVAPPLRKLHVSHILHCSRYIHSLLLHLTLVSKAGLAPLISGSVRDKLTFSFEVCVLFGFNQDGSHCRISLSWILSTFDPFIGVSCIACQRIPSRTFAQKKRIPTSHTCTLPSCLSLPCRAPVVRFGWKW